MGKGDRRNSLKMRRRRSKGRFKARIVRRRERLRREREQA